MKTTPQTLTTFRLLRTLIWLPALLAVFTAGTPLARATLASGNNYDGTILLNQTNSWTLTATAGDRIVLRGAALTSTNYFYPWMRIYNPSGALVGDSGGGNYAMAVEAALTATNSGTFTVLVNDSAYGGVAGTGDYRLYFAQFPGSFVVPAGDQGGSLTSGGTYDGTIQLGDLDVWSFTATTGDRVVARMGALTAAGYFNPWVRIYGPTGVLLSDTGAGSYDMAEEAALTVTNSGTFTVLVGDSTYGGADGTGNYRLHFAQFPSAFVVPAGDQGGSLTSGGTYDGTIHTGDLDVWSFTATTGDRVVARMGALTAAGYFNPWVRIYGPTGVLLSDTGSGSNGSAEEAALTATNSGAFTVLVGDSAYGGVAGTGDYRLYFAQFPGSFVVPAGDQGGSLTSGGSYEGTIQTGDLDVWSFTATTGDRVVARMGALTAAGYFNPWVRIYGPTGVLLSDTGAGSYGLGEEAALTATNSGTFTVLVGDSAYGGVAGTGDYRLSFAQSSGSFVVPAGDEGGSLTNGVDALGSIPAGDLDLYRFTACKGDYATLRMDTLTATNYFNPWLRLYGPGGGLVADSGGGGFNTTALVALALTNSGVYTVLVGDSAYGGVHGSGTYRLTNNGLSDGLKMCIPVISGTNVNLAGIGGGSNATYVLFTQTNVAAPASLWTPIRTNQFDSFGVFAWTNLFNPAEPQRFFRLRSP